MLMRSYPVSMKTFYNSRDGESLSVLCTDPNGSSQEGVTLMMHSSDGTTAVALDQEEVSQLHQTLGGLLSRKRPEQPPAVLVIPSEEEDGGRKTFRVCYTNWGEPYDEGASFAVQVGYESTSVNLVSREVGDLHLFLGTVLEKDYKSPSPSR
jgi:hypothetical protein